MKKFQKDLRKQLFNKLNAIAGIYVEVPFDDLDGNYLHIGRNIVGNYITVTFKDDRIIYWFPKAGVADAVHVLSIKYRTHKEALGKLVDLFCGLVFNDL